MKKPPGDVKMLWVGWKNGESEMRAGRKKEMRDGH